MTTLVRADFETFLTGTLSIVNDAEPDTFGLHLVHVSGSPTLLFLPTTGAFAGQGVTHGLLTMTVVTAVSSGSQAIGLCCLCSQRDMRHGAGGQGYSVEFHPGNGQLLLRKLTDGLSSGTLLAMTTFSGSFTDLRLLWAVGPDDAWVLLLVLVGAAEHLRYQDVSLPYVTSVSEGGFYEDGGSGLPFDIRYLTLTLDGA